MIDPATWAKGVGDLVKGYVARALLQIEARLTAIESRPVPQDGKSVTLDEVQPLVEQVLRAHMAAILPPGEPIATLVAARSIADDKIMPIIERLAAIEGRPSIDERFDAFVADVARAAATTTARISELEQRQPQKGDKGEPGKSVTLDEVREAFMDLYTVHQSAWALDFERRAQDLLLRSIERMPAPKDGKDGRDGVSFDEMQVSQVDERTLRYSYVRGGEVILSHDFEMRVPIYREIFRNGENYRRDDFVTFGGNLWCAVRDTEAKPGTDDSWRLAVRAGRDGRRE